jgi:hypothetical protein
VRSSRGSVVVESCLVHYIGIGPVGRSLRIVIARGLSGLEDNRRDCNTIEKKCSKGNSNILKMLLGLCKEENSSLLL